MKKIKDSFGVDAGNISVMDLAYIHSHGGMYGPTAAECCKVIDLKPGTYKVTIKIDDCWDGAIDESFELTTKGRVVIGDACYLFSYGEPSNDHWPEFLELTDYLRLSNDNVGFFSTGGDGEFLVEVSFEKLED
jgi:hypothetical protein